MSWISWHAVEMVPECVLSWEGGHCWQPCLCLEGALAVAGKPPCTAETSHGQHRSASECSGLSVCWALRHLECHFILAGPTALLEPDGGWQEGDEPSYLPHCKGNLMVLAECGYACASKKDNGVIFKIKGWEGAMCVILEMKGSVLSMWTRWF